MGIVAAGGIPDVFWRRSHVSVNNHTPKSYRADEETTGGERFARRVGGFLKGFWLRLQLHFLLQIPEGFPLPKGFL
jgi:hypothetical protein